MTRYVGQAGLDVAAELAKKRMQGGMRPVTGSTAFALPDREGVVVVTSSALQTVTLPAFASVPWPVGTRLRLSCLGAGGVDLIDAANGNTAIRIVQYQSIELECIGTDQWTLWNSVAGGSGGTGTVDTSSLVALTGNQTIGGVKTFSTAPVFPADSVGAAYLIQAEIKEIIRDTVLAALQSGNTGLTVNAAGTDDALDKITLNLVPGAILSQLGIPQTIFINPTTGVWPARTLLPGYTLLYVVWDSQSYPGAAAPSGKLDQDLWDGRRAVA